MRTRLFLLFALLCLAVSSARAYELKESFNTTQKTNTYQTNHLKITCDYYGSDGMEIGGLYERFVYVKSKHNEIIRKVTITLTDAAYVYTIVVSKGNIVRMSGEKTVSLENINETSMYFFSSAIDLVYVDHVDVYFEPTELAPDAAGSYAISNAEEWKLFCDMVNSGDNFSGKTVYLTNDIEVTDMAGNYEGTDKCFSGTFDGQGHTLTVNLQSDKNRCAPFRIVKDGTIQSLRVAGTIQCYNYSGGIVGAIEGTVTLRNCCSAVNITSNNPESGTDIGGLVGCCNTNGSLNIEGCSFTGTIAAANTNCGGLVGHVYPDSNPTNSVSISNCVVNPGSVICGNNSSTITNRGTFTNCYYFSAIGTAQGKQAYSITVDANRDVTMENAGIPATDYSTSSITAYPTGVRYNNVLYAGTDDIVNLTLTPSAGYTVSSVSASAGTLSGTKNPYSLTMPADNVVITANVVEGYKVAVDDVVKDGVKLVGFTTDKEIYTAGETVTLTATLQQGFVLENVTVKDGSGTPVEVTNVSDTEYKYAFTMPAANVTVGYDYYKDSGSYAINWSGNGTMVAQINGINVMKADENDVVTIRLSDEMKRLAVNVVVTGATSGNVSVTKNSALGDNVYSFTMPAEAVTVSADFKYVIQMMTSGHCVIEASVNNGQPTVVDGYVGTMVADENDVVTLTVTPEAGNAVSQVLLGYTLINGEYTLTNATKVDATHYSFHMPAAMVIVYPTCAFVLADGADNSAALTTQNGNYLDVMLQGRTLYKDDMWNTLCLPFDLDVRDFDKSLGNKELVGDTHPLDGATVMVLDTEGTYDDAGQPSEGGAYRTGFDAESGTLYLYFKAPETSPGGVVIPAGTPCIIKWEGDYMADPLVDPTICGVTINNAATEVSFTGGKFVGNYSPISITGEDRSILFLGEANTLYYPNNNMQIGAFRAHFELEGGENAVRSFVMNFGESNAQSAILNPQFSTPDSQFSVLNSGWYDMQGRCLSGKPTQSGVYLHNGKKVVIK